MKHHISNAFNAITYQPHWWWTVAVFWGVFASISFFWQYNRLENDAIEMATLRGRLVFSMVKITRSWNAEHGGLYAAITKESPVNPYLAHPDKFATTGQGKALTLINPAYMTRQINTLLAANTDLKIHLTSLTPMNPGNVPDDWERQSLIGFEKEAKEQLTFQGSGKDEIFRYMAPMHVEPGCMKCHAAQGYQIGQVRGGLSVTQPASYITGLIDSQIYSIFFIHVSAFLLLTLGRSSVCGRTGSKSSNLKRHATSANKLPINWRIKSTSWKPPATT